MQVSYGDFRRAVGGGSGGRDAFWEEGFFLSCKDGKGKKEIEDNM
jgi:hypothetical protein